MNTILATAARSHVTGNALSQVQAGMEAMRRHGLNGGYYDAPYKEVARTLAMCDNNEQNFRTQGRLTSDIMEQFTKAREDALAKWNDFVEGILKLDRWHVANYPKTRKGEQEREALMFAAVKATQDAKIAAEQAIVDVVAHAIDTVTEAGGWINVVTDVSHTISWGQTDVHVRKSVQINGIDVSALPFDVRQTILTHGERIAGEVMARQAAALAAPAPEPVVVEAV
jgi:hypothetical protein